MKKQEYALTTRGNLSNNLPYLPTEYSVKPGLKKLEDEPHFIIDEWYPDYRNEKMDARLEDINKYYIEQTASKDLHPQEYETAHRFVMKTIIFWMIYSLTCIVII